MGSIADTDRLRHAGNEVVFDQIRAPSTVGSFPRAFGHGHVQRLNAVLRHTLIRLAERAPLLPRAQQVVFVDLDSAHREVFGYAKQARRWAAGYGQSSQCGWGHGAAALSCRTHTCQPCSKSWFTS